MNVFLSIDLGAGSGRVIAGKTNNKILELEEVHRFNNPGTDLPGGSFWNLIGLYRDIVEGLRIANSRYGKNIVAIGIDTWGCDFGLFDSHGRLLGMPHQYRDTRHEGMADVMHQKMPEQEIYKHTGIVSNFYNSSLHLLAEKQLGSPALESADQLLFIPDILAYWLCGRRAVERTVASTSQLIDPATGDWAWPVIDALELPRKIFGEIVAPGTVLGPLRSELLRETGLEGIPVVASASHDTASAVAGIPMEGEDQLWLSSGTWSIMGLETRDPILTSEAYSARCCNELGFDNKVRFLKNIGGLWLIQECKRQWALEGEDISYGDMAKLAAEEEAHTAFIDPDDPVFSSPGDMPTRIREYCKKTGQSIPATKGAVLRVATESLALKYRVVLEDFQRLSGKSFDRLNAGGGGIQNRDLAQSTANATGIEVLAGPVEATSCGNIIIQMIATGHLSNLTEGRKLIRDSFEFHQYSPTNTDQWNVAYDRFLKLLG